MNMSDDCLVALVRLYKVTCVTALSEMVGMDGAPNDNQLDASIEAGVRAVAEAVGEGLAPPAEAASKRTAADDLRDYGNAFEVDGRRIEPWRVAVYPRPTPAKYERAIRDALKEAQSGNRQKDQIVVDCLKGVLRSAIDAPDSKP
jgi:hypothetical protein